MTPLTIILLTSWLAGLTALAGGVIASLERSVETEAKSEIIHGIVAFGGGILIAAVAFALVPEGIAHLGATVLAVCFCAGGVSFCLLDAWLSRRGGSSSQFMAMMLDFIPEARSLGAVFAENRRLGMLLAAFIGAQNVPEGFNAFREVVSGGMRRGAALTALAVASLVGPLAACIGYYVLHGREELTAGIMTFAAGGILYLIFQDIAPQSKLTRHWTPPLGAVLGFLVGILGKKLIG